MKKEYLDLSGSASETAVATVTEILKVARVKMGKAGFPISVLEPAMPAAIKALFKNGFHRTTGLIYPTGAQPLTLRRLGVIVEVGMPRAIFGGYSKSDRKHVKLYLSPMSLSNEGKIAKTVEDSRIDISYESVHAMYKEREELNAWREHMQFVLPKDRQIAAIISLLDRSIELHSDGSAVDRDLFVVGWGNERLTHAKLPGARLVYIPSTGRYELEVRVGAFSWSAVGSHFDFLTIAEQLKLNVERHLKACDDGDGNYWLNNFNDRLEGFETAMED